MSGNQRWISISNKIQKDICRQYKKLELKMSSDLLISMTSLSKQFFQKQLTEHSMQCIFSAADHFNTVYALTITETSIC